MSDTEFDAGKVLSDPIFNGTSKPERTYTESEMQLERAELRAVIKYECEQKMIAIEVALKLQDEMAERVREAVLAELEDFSKTLNESDWAATRSNAGDDELMRRILKYRAAAGAQEPATEYGKSRSMDKRLKAQGAQEKKKDSDRVGR